MNCKLIFTTVCLKPNGIVSDKETSLLLKVDIVLYIQFVVKQRNGNKLLLYKRNCLCIYFFYCLLFSGSHLLQNNFNLILHHHSELRKILIRYHRYKVHIVHWCITYKDESNTRYIHAQKRCQNVNILLQTQHCQDIAADFRKSGFIHVGIR